MGVLWGSMETNACSACRVTGVCGFLGRSKDIRNIRHANFKSLHKDVTQSRATSTMLCSLWCFTVTSDP